MPGYKLNPSRGFGGGPGGRIISIANTGGFITPGKNGPVQGLVGLLFGLYGPVQLEEGPELPVTPGI